MKTNTNNDHTLRDYLTILFRYKLLTLGIIITAVIIAFLKAQLLTPAYIASVKVLLESRKMIAETDYNAQLMQSFQSLALKESNIMTSRPVLERVVKALNLDQIPIDRERRFSSKIKRALIDYRTKDIKENLAAMNSQQRQAFLFNYALQKLRGNLNVFFSDQTFLLSIKVSDYNPVAAAIIANSISRSYLIYDLQQQIAEMQLRYGEKYSAIVILNNQIEKIRGYLNGQRIPDLDARGPASAKIIEQAEIPSEPVQGPNTMFMIMAAAFVGFMTSVLLSFGLEFLDQTFKTPTDIKKHLNIPFLGSIPKRKQKDKLLVEYTDRVTEYGHSFQNISDQICLFIKDKNLKSLLIADVEGNGDIPAIIANISNYLTQKAGRKVLIMDTNFRGTSTMSNVFNVSADADTGLANVLEGKIDLDDAIQILNSDLNYLPSGETELNPANLLATSMITEIIKKVREHYDIIFINCSDLQHYTDAVLLSDVTDGTVIVINEGKSRRQVIKSAIAPLEKRDTTIIGSILNGRKYEIPEVIYKIT